MPAQADTGAAPLIERERELAALDAALDDAAAGRGRAVAVVGEPGIGKSRLLAAARERGRAAGMLVCGARGAELERAFPFGLVRQLAASSYANTTVEERASWFTGVARLAAPLFGEPSVAVSSAHDGESRLYALYWLCANAARRRPLVLVADDAQWADEASLGFVGFIARRVGELPMLLLLGTRPPDPGDTPELARMLTDPDTTTLTPGPLSSQGVTLLLQGILTGEPDPAFADACRHVTHGNPFLLTELAEEIRAEGIEPSATQAGRIASLTPAGVRTTALLRLARLSEHARQLARTLALLGDHAALSVAAELAKLDEASAVAAAVQLEKAGIVASNGGLGYVHPLLRAAVNNEVPSVERAAGHAAAARVLAGRGAAPDEIAVHLLAAAPAGDPWVVETLRQGAQRALELGDPEAGAAYLSRALDEPAGASERPRILLELGVAEARSGGATAAARLSEAAATAVDPDTRCEATQQLGQVLNLAGRAAEAAEALEEGIAALSERPDLADALRAELIATAYMRLSSRERLDPLIRSLREPVGLPVTQLELVGTAALAVEHAIARGDPAHGAELARRVLASPYQASGRATSGQIPVPIFLALIVAEQLEEAEAAVTAALEVARREGSAPGVAAMSSRRASIRLRRDDLLGAEADASACFELLADKPGTEAIAMGAAGAAVLAGVELGRSPADLERIIAAHHGDPDYPSHLFVLLADGTLRSLAGDFQGALARFEQCGSSRWLRDCPALSPWRSASAHALARLGRAAEAREHAAEELRLTRAAGTPRALGVALQAVAAVAEDDQERELRLDEAVSVLEQTEAALELARSLLARGALRRRTGRRRLAREDLQRAHDLAAARGAVRLADAAAEELRSSGARLRPAHSADGADALTPAERRVAELAATGLTNREIAQSLFLSEKTVEAHLGRTYRKLGIRSRGRLAAALGGP